MGGRSVSSWLCCALLAPGISPLPMWGPSRGALLCPGYPVPQQLHSPCPEPSDHLTVSFLLQTPQLSYAPAHQTRFVCALEDGLLWPSQHRHHKSWAKCYQSGSRLPASYLPLLTYLGSPVPGHCIPALDQTAQQTSLPSGGLRPPTESEPQPQGRPPHPKIVLPLGTFPQLWCTL